MYLNNYVNKSLKMKTFNNVPAACSHTVPISKRLEQLCKQKLENES